MMGSVAGQTWPIPRRAEDREAWVQRLEERFNPIASALGLVFVLIVIGENLAVDGSGLEDALLIAGWVIWLVFVAEFVLRAGVAPSTTTFLRRNWWQVLFLALPFLRFIAALRIARLARAGRILTSAIRGTRSAGQMLRDRMTWIAVVHTIVVLAASQLLFEFSDAGETYGEVLHSVALASVSGEPLGFDTGLAQIFDVALAFYAVVVFATAAGVLGAYFLDRSAADMTAAGTLRDGTAKERTNPETRLDPDDSGRLHTDARNPPGIVRR